MGEAMDPRVTSFLSEELADILERTNGNPKTGLRREALSIAAVLVDEGVELSTAMRTFVSQSLLAHADAYATGRPFQRRRKATEGDAIALEYLMGLTGGTESACADLMVEYLSKDLGPDDEKVSARTLRRRHREHSFRLSEDEITQLRKSQRAGHPAIDALLSWSIHRMRIDQRPN